MTEVLSAGVDHQVVSISGGRDIYRKKPCSDCPWRTDAIGQFSPEAFRHTANTAYDMAEKAFACHQSTTRKPATCAGFLLRGAEHNIGVRLGYVVGKYKHDVSDDGHELHDNYRAMAIANGVDPDDPALAPCRD